MGDTENPLSKGDARSAGACCMIALGGGAKLKLVGIVRCAQDDALGVTSQGIPQPSTPMGLPRSKQQPEHQQQEQ